MDIFYIILIIFLSLVLLVLLTSFICFRLTFYVTKRQKKLSAEQLLPPDKIYVPYHNQMLAWQESARKMDYEDVYITAFDGLTLHAKYYEGEVGAPLEIMFHGYRGTAERDMCGGIQRAFSLNRNVLLIDQRTSGQSQGNVITFGIKERYDCLYWAKYAAKRFPDVDIILTGISMGATTVLMATELNIPKNVKSVIADCGFSSPKAIIKKVVKQMHLPAFIFYPLIKLGARLFGKFNLEEASPEKALKNCKIPVIFAHGDCDDFVPCEMSKINYDACASIKQLVIIKGAGHGLCYLKEPETYLKALDDFYNKINK